MQKFTVNYKQIYADILEKKYPEKKAECQLLLEKEYLNALDVIKINAIIFGLSPVETKDFNQKHRSYSRSDISRIMEYQRKNQLNNSQLALEFHLSKNTIIKWKALNDET